MSETQRTSKYVAVTLDTDEERVKVPCIHTCSWKEKLAVLCYPGFNGLNKEPKL